MKKRERVYTSLNHNVPDRTPVDIQGVPEIWEKLFKHFNTSNMKTVMDKLEIDCAWVDPEVLRIPNKKDDDGFIIGWGGSRCRIVCNRFGEYLEIVHYATDDCETEKDIDHALKLPDLRDMDFTAVETVCKEFDDYFLLGGFASTFYYPTLVRRMEDILIDMDCCGSAYHLINEIIDMGIRILDPVQTVAQNMQPERLKKEFGDRITFHGAGETQNILPNGTPDDVRDNAKMLSRVLGENGGYIMSSCHNLQADVPLENVLAFYEIGNRAE